MGPADVSTTLSCCSFRRAKQTKIEDAKTRFGERENQRGERRRIKQSFQGEGRQERCEEGVGRGGEGIREEGREAGPASRASCRRSS
eukprot:753017-Hanusia_phi.AAC.7